MPEHDAVDFAGEQLGNDRGSGGVGKMAVPRLNPLFHRPGPVRIVLQKFLVVIRLDDERLHLAQPLDREAGGMPEVGDVTERARAGVESVTDRLDRIVRHREAFHRDVAD